MICNFQSVGFSCHSRNCVLEEQTFLILTCKSLHGASGIGSKNSLPNPRLQQCPPISSCSLTVLNFIFWFDPFLVSFLFGLVNGARYIGFYGPTSLLRRDLRKGHVEHPLCSGLNKCFPLCQRSFPVAR